MVSKLCRRAGLRNAGDCAFSPGAQAALSALCALALSASPAHAEVNPVQGLVGFAALAETQGQAAIYRFDAACPDAGDRCKTSKTLPKGAIIMISDPGYEGDDAPTYARFVYTPDGTKPSVAGAVRWSDLRSYEPPAPDIEAWKGVYYAVTDPERGATASLSVRVVDTGELRMAGQAIRGASQMEDPPEGAPQSFFDSAFSPDGARAIVEAGDDCQLAVARLGPYLAVEEDGDPCTIEGEPGFAGLYLREGDTPMNPKS